MSVGRMIGLGVFATAMLVAGAQPARANMCDLTVASSSCGPSGVGWDNIPINSPSNQPFASSAIFQQVNPQPTGTGYIDSFLRIQHSATEEGYNTDARPFQAGMDMKDPINYTHAITLAEVPIVNISGIDYRQFYLDINENNSANGHLLSLDKLQIFLGANGGFNSYQTGGANGNGKLNGVAPIYDMDTGLSSTFNDNWIKLDYTTNNGGSGIGDMVAYIPNAAFGGAAGGTNVYLYSQFGATMAGPTNLTSDAGFEEWWVKSPIQTQFTQSVPEPATLLLLASGLLIAGRGLKRKSKLFRNSPSNS
jgi:hypothetical protein